MKSAWDTSEAGKAYYKLYGKARHEKMRLAAFMHYSNGNPRCVCCGITDLQFLSIDHIDGGGKAHLRREGNKPLVYLLQRDNYPDGYQILCYNCNCAKSFAGYCHNPPTKQDA